MKRVERLLLVLLWASIALLVIVLLRPASAEEIVYGVNQVGPPPRINAGFKAEKFSGDGLAVGGQFNGWSHGGRGWTFGIAAEVIGWSGEDYLIGVENLVVNLNPNNRRTKIANNAVFGCRTWWDAQAGRPCVGPNNVASIAYWVSSQPETGFESGLKFDRWSLAPSERYPNPAVIDLRDVPMEKLLTWCIVALPNNRCVMVNEVGGLFTR